MEQVFSRSTSASSALSTCTMPRCARSRSSMRDESYSFIWQPWVSMKTVLGAFLVSFSDGFSDGCSDIVLLVRVIYRERGGTGGNGADCT